MAVQWSLVIFTLLTGAAGWCFAALAFDAVRGKNQDKALAVTIVALVLMVVGGAASVTHLAHPGNMLAALNNPTSGIFVEAMLVGLSSVYMIVFAILVKRDAAPMAAKVFAVVGGVLGVALSYLAGSSYLMEAISSWNTVVLPLGYLATAVPAGIALYLAVVGGDAEDPQALLVVMVVGAVLGAVLGLVYALGSGSEADVTLLLYGGVVACGGLVPVVCGLLAFKRRAQMRTLMAVACACALVGALCFRVIMWETFVLAAAQVGAPYITDFMVL